MQEKLNMKPNKIRKKFIFYLLLGFGLTLVTFQKGFSHLQDSTAWENLSPETFYMRMHQTYHKVILDVRLFSEYRKERIPDAILASRREELISIVDTLDRDTPVFVYCEDGERSETVCKILTNEKNFQRVYNLRGGIYMWKKVGLPVDDKKIKVNLWKKIFQ